MTISTLCRAKVMALFFVSALMIAHAEGGVSPTPHATYENAARTFSEKIAAGMWQGGNTVPRKPLDSQKRDIMFDETLGYPVRDCSDSKHRCLSSSHQVYAVPRARLAPSDSYVVGGAVFKVEECLRGDASICQVALISSDCQKSVGKDLCEEAPGGRVGSKDDGPLIYFIYNEDFGVTAFGVTKSPAGSAAERLAVASHMILQGAQGLLVK